MIHDQPHYSSSMSHLTTEVRTNKNGVPVRKRVRVNGTITSKTTVPAPSMTFDVPAAMAMLDVICSRIPKPDDVRSPLIRELVYAGMEDDEAVNFLALVYMPQELLEETYEFINSRPKSSHHRQAFFRFANDAYFEMPPEQANVFVANAIRSTPEAARFSEFMKERFAGMGTHGIEPLKPMNGTDVLAAQSMVAVLDAASKVPAREASRYMNASEFLNRNGTNEYVEITDSELARLVLQAGERCPEMVAVIRDRKTLDPDLIASILDAPAPAVSHGIL